MLDIKESTKKEASAFKKFVSRGNVVDMAVGVIVGGAFGKIVTSFVNDLIMPIVGLFLGGLDFKALSIKIKDSTIAYGNFIQSVVDFFIVAFCIFVIVRVFDRFKKKEAQAENVSEPAQEEPKKSAEVLILEEIRDLLDEKIIDDRMNSFHNEKNC